MLPVIQTIVSQHAEEAAFIWLLRDKAVHEPHYTLNDLAGLDGRVEAHIDGLRIAGDEGWGICREVLTFEEAGEVFTFAVLAFESGNEARINEVIDAGSADPKLARGLISALGWISYQQAEKYIQNFLSSESVDLLRIGIAASAIHRQDPGNYISEAISSDDFLLKARALKAAGELGRKDLLPYISTSINDQEDNCRFWASWSASILGNSKAVQGLTSFIRLENPPLPTTLPPVKKKRAEEAIRIAFRRMDLQSAHNFQKELAQNQDTLRLALLGAGVIGDPVLIPWLIEYMSIPEMARMAGESFSMITGIDIAYESFEGEWPEGFEAGPTENPEDENVEMDPDEDLPWPKPELIQKWWKEHESTFRKGERYLCDKPMTIDQLQYVLRYGYQRQRKAAALELAIRQPGIPLFETRAPGFRQQRLLNLK